MHATYPTHFILFDLKCTSYKAPHYAVSSLLGSNILLSTLFLNTLNLCSSLSVRDQVSHPYKTTGKSIFIYILGFLSFWRGDRKTKDSEQNGSSHSLNLICS
jgi:hypothetical protein